MHTTFIVIATLLTLSLAAFNATAKSPPGTAKATFVVHCYDVGVSALEGRPGVISVEPGWSGPREVDRVVFNPGQVSVFQLETWLKEAGTYLGTLETERGKKSAKEMLK